MLHEGPFSVTWQSIAALDTPFRTDDREYRVGVDGQQRADGTWSGRVVFRAGGETRVTGQETSQPNRQALEYWARGLEKVFLDGAFTRSKKSRRIEGPQT